MSLKLYEVTSALPFHDIEQREKEVFSSSSAQIAGTQPAAKGHHRGLEWKWEVTVLGARKAGSSAGQEKQDRKHAR